MKRSVIEFTKPYTAAYYDEDLPSIENGEVLVKMEYTVISGGTEKACITAMPNVAGAFPRRLGYCGIGIVEDTHSSVTKFKKGDRVLVYHGFHTNYNIRPEDKLTKVEDDNIDSLEAAFVIIAAMGLGGVRKLEIELGESAMVMGLGLLGIFSVQFLALSGANPLIAADPNPERRKLALELGADYALDPLSPDFKDRVMEITKGKGVNATVEVTGVSSAMNQALDVASYMGRIALLGCTRISDSSVDYYQQVHRPGIRLIGAHNFVRPKVESYPHHWTHHDDCRAILDLISAGKVKVKPIASRVASPEDAPKIFEELCNDNNFPIGTVFDWRNI